MGVKNIKNKIKIGLTIIIAVILALSVFVQAQNTRDEHIKTLDFNNKIFTYKFTNDDFEFSSFQDYDIIKLKDGGILNEIGKPIVPIKNILVALPENTKVSLDIYNISGQKIKTLVDKIQNKGFHEVNFNESNLSSGIYFYKLKTQYNVKTQKMMLVK